ncbi:MULTISPECIES: porin [unclassified Beijerinckia]|uniref:porin n=1 Tax=unclassified Beijerinckia TaxID=2638183 RepID=UPI001114BEB6|nr:MULTISPECIES: porin [unclassified Beijerinckia]
MSCGLRQRRGSGFTFPEAIPIEYVRICHCYGPIYYWIWGVDTCLKAGCRGDDVGAPPGRGQAMASRWDPFVRRCRRRLLAVRPADVLLESGRRRSSLFPYCLLPSRRFGVDRDPAPNE